MVFMSILLQPSCWIWISVGWVLELHGRNYRFQFWVRVFGIHPKQGLIFKIKKQLKLDLRLSLKTKGEINPPTPKFHLVFFSRIKPIKIKTRPKFWKLSCSNSKWVWGAKSFAHPFLVFGFVNFVPPMFNFFVFTTIHFNWPNTTKLKLVFWNLLKIEAYVGRWNFGQNIWDKNMVLFKISWGKTSETTKKPNNPNVPHPPKNKS